MQSLAQIADPDLTREQLPTRGSRLALPRGWIYRVQTLDADLALVGAAVAVQDDFKNAYLRR